MKSNWTLEKRQQLEHLLAEGFNVNQVRELVGGSASTILKEIKRGVSEEEYNQKRFVKYSFKQAIYKEVLENIGKEQLDILLNEYKGRW